MNAFPTLTALGLVRYPVKDITKGGRGVKYPTEEARLQARRLARERYRNKLLTGAG